ncbi:MAG: hypothetical protein CO013_06350 [Syntrophobacterales bacterium CG_4_8_14_3_um_filter_58_8]|nr:MAG: hypothetical protein AUK26_14465 [Syntrophaceae bacterium CG2_30_58_14]PIV07102.1 MAG: hypothetical protein COS57_00945 [Syntrophobacterales bacterium CG03_land_8_20_14_0_80_58_14]PJC73644.1 MAG: hypothetical protein CO013_06350 [Syntrophobacterales bacterium CG_4_8_14_3_um_filter_58_8]
MHYRFLSLLVAAVIAVGIGGCGGGGTSADPLGTDSLMFGHKNNSTGTDWSMVMEVDPRGTVVLTAKIKNASGKEVADREVTFEFKVNQSGATLNASKVNTDAAGEAAVIYTAGMVNGFDVVNASISNGAQMDTNITVGSGAAGGNQLTFAGSPTMLASTGGSSILTATVKAADGTLQSGVAVTFSIVTDGTALSTISDSLGTSRTIAGPPLSVNTDTNGQAWVVFTGPGGVLAGDAAVQAQITGRNSALVISW